MILRKVYQRTCVSRRGLAQLVQGPASRIGSSLHKEPRASDQCDVVIVGGGPAGMAAAIRLRQLATEAGKGEEFRVVLLEKAAEIGGHILSGAVIETRALDELLPDWKARNAPLTQPALRDKMRFLTEKHSIPLPHPPQMNNKGNYIVSLSDVTKWLGEQAESVGVEVFPGIAASEVIYDNNGQVKGVATNDMGVSKKGEAKPNFERGMEFHARVTLFSEGCRGSLTKELSKKYNLRADCEQQTFAIGLKEVWEIEPSKHEAGTVVHSVGWPLPSDTYGGSWIYHTENNQISIGLVVALDYSNPYMNPYKEFQRLKLHPSIKPLLQGGKCLSYGARALNEGGYQSIPTLTFPGGALIGATAGFMNVPKIKGTHTAMKSGMLAAESVYSEITQRGTDDYDPLHVKSYEQALKESWVYSELKQVRNIRPSFHSFLGIYGGLLYSGLDTLFLRGRVPWTFSHGKPDHERLKPASASKQIEYPKPDGLVSFDLLTNLSRTGVNHDEDQPVHLTLKDPGIPTAVNLAVYDGPEGRFCPAGVYEYVEDTANGGKKLQINAQNCIHCKTCDIKDPSQNIDWVTPQGSGGPQYTGT